MFSCPQRQLNKDLVTDWLTDSVQVIVERHYRRALWEICYLWQFWQLWQWHLRSKRVIPEITFLSIENNNHSIHSDPSIKNARGKHSQLFRYFIYISSGKMLRILKQQKTLCLYFHHLNPIYWVKLNLGQFLMRPGWAKVLDKMMYFVQNINSEI